MPKFYLPKWPVFKPSKTHDLEQLHVMERNKKDLRHHIAKTDILIALTVGRL